MIILRLACVVKPTGEFPKRQRILNELASAGIVQADAEIFLQQMPCTYVPQVNTKDAVEHFNILAEAESGEVITTHQIAVKPLRLVVHQRTFRFVCCIAGSLCASHLMWWKPVVGQRRILCTPSVLKALSPVD